MFSFRTTPLENQLDKALTDGKVGCFCTQNCWDTSSDRYMYQIFRERGNLVRLFQPEDAELTPGTNHIHFDSESLKGLNAIVVEIQDVGSRYFNYTKDIFRLMMLLMVIDEPPALYIVDHINPAGRVVEGTVPTGECESFIPRVAHRHGRSQISAPCDLGIGIGLQQGPAAVDDCSGFGHTWNVHLLHVQRRRFVEQHEYHSGHRYCQAV